MNNVLVIGASSGIANALINTFIEDNNIDQIVAISRGESNKKLADHPKVVWKISNYSESSIETIISELKNFQSSFIKVFICNGVLHTNEIYPEKKIEDLSAVHLQEIFQINTIVPSLWLKMLRRLLLGKKICQVVLFSARIGSIGDNQLGGWYSYRASKAALNMLVKTASIEYARRAKNVQLVLFHPGTTDTLLSKPFQANVPKEKLFTTEFVAKQLLSVLSDRINENNKKILFVDWDNKLIPW
ncbi:MAG: SDR family NAD(P)-dependent oxidoreductase [Cellvibrionaceae bacterium]